MTDTLDQSTIVQYITDTFAGVDVVVGADGIAAGDTFFSYDPNLDLEPQRRMPFATIVTKDYGEFDCSSNLNRPDVYRLNIGVTRATFRSLFGSPVEEQDYTALDRLMPHPVYAAQSFVCIVNPSRESFETLKPLLAEAYDQVVKRLEARAAAGRQ